MNEEELGHLIRLTMLDELEKKNKPDFTIKPEDVAFATIKRRIELLSKEEGQRIYDQAASDTAALIEQIFSSIDAAPDEKRKEYLTGLLAMLDMWPFTKERYDKCFDRLFQITLAEALLKDKAQ